MSWFRDGTRLLISGAVGPGDHENDTSSIWLVSILGGKPRTLRGGAYRAELSPDDSLIAYQGGADGKLIMLADANGENPREFITTGPLEFVGSPVWSPDGKRVIYRRLSEENGSTVGTIESRGLEDEASAVLVRGAPSRMSNIRDVFGADFLMLDDRLVYARSEPPPRSRDLNLWEVRVDPRSGEPQGEPRRLTDWAGFKIGVLSATADGSQIAFLNHRSQADVYVGDLGDRGRILDNVRRLTLDDRNDDPACWTPDSTGVVFRSDRYGSGDLLVQPLDQQAPHDLVTGEGDQEQPHLTPDGAS
ncbi:MAG: hypothetical protein R3344_11010, partial [Acidobacteriota bacterium]|nr:hypothetical protein [Acidobacteriota bacterium]